MVILTRVNVEKHMDRWYMAGVQTTLFDTFSGEDHQTEN